MKDVNKEVIGYYIKLAQKLSKKKRIFFERKEDIVYFTDGSFAVHSVWSVKKNFVLCVARLIFRLKEIIQENIIMGNCLIITYLLKN